MTPRIASPHDFAPATIKAMMGVEATFSAYDLDHVLIELVKLRASQINGCAFCIHMHTTLLRRSAVPEMKLYLLSAWRDSTLFSEAERAALAWTESLTRVADGGANDTLYETLSAHFTETQRVQLTLVIGAINLWNRFSVAFHLQHPSGAADVAA